MIIRGTSFLGVAFALSMLSAPAYAQSPGQPTIPVTPPPMTRGSVRLVIVNDDSVDRLTQAQRDGAASTSGYLLRSSSSLTEPSDSPGARPIRPQVRSVYNKAIPYSPNEGGMWAGRGVAYLFTGGADIRAGHLRILFAPQFALSTNRWWLLRDSARFVPPTTRSDRLGRGYRFPWYTGPYSIDLPLRYGDVNLSRLSLGQSSVSIGGDAVEFGFATENEWWGPGVQNAIVLSNNAPGFPHLFFRSARPLGTPLGMMEFRWLTGSLYESAYFDGDPSNDVRSIAAAAMTFTPRRPPGLSFGLARSVYGTSSGTGEGLFRWFNIFRNTGHPNDVPLADSTLTPGGTEQIISLFGRWVMPESGLETYAEWARTDFPKSLRDFLVYPNHTQGYTLGLQWSAAAFRPEGRSRIQAEVTNLEQSSTFRDRPIGSWYTSRRVVQGYTNQGQVLGAAIGPGSSSQWLAWDYLTPGWRAGVYGGRIRWNEDMRSVFNWPNYLEYCNHDVSLFLGGRAARHTRFGFISADLALTNRINAFYQKQSTCSDTFSEKDIRNQTLTISFAP
jgi:Capsule assembly protein Wzi